MVHFLKFLFSKVFIINLLVAIVLLGGGLYLTLDYLDDYTLHGQTLEVPNLEGKDLIGPIKRPRLPIFNL